MNDEKSLIHVNNMEPYRTPQYLCVLLNYVAGSTVSEEHFSERCTESMRLYELWRKESVSLVIPEYCAFASFISKQIVNGQLLQKLCEREKLLVALDFIYHIIMEEYIKDRVWRVQNNWQQVVELLTRDCTPDEILQTFRIEKWSEVKLR